MSVRTAPYWSLKKVYTLIKLGQVDFEGDALEFADADFGWGPMEILVALKSLRQADWYKSDSKKKDNPGNKIQLDYYRSNNLKGEQVFTHFYIRKDEEQNERLVVDSFHHRNRRG